MVGDNVVFTWESTGATGLTYRCSLNGGAQFDCEFHCLNTCHYCCIPAPIPPSLLCSFSGTSPYELPLASLQQGENTLAVNAFLSDGREAGGLQLTVTVGASKL